MTPTASKLSDGYRIEHGSYYFYRDGAVQFMCDEVSVFFDRDSLVLHGHGRPESIQAKHEKWVRQINTSIEGGTADSIAVGRSLIDGLTVIEGKFPCDELNRLIESASYLERFCAKVIPALLLPLDDGDSSSPAP